MLADAFRGRIGTVPTGNAAILNKNLVTALSTPLLKVYMNIQLIYRLYLLRYKGVRTHA